MRKPRDYDTELKTLTDRANQLKARKVQQLGELVIASGADALPIDMLAGVFAAAAKEKDPAVREGWRKAGANFFQGARRAPGRTRANDASATSNVSGSIPIADGKSTA